MSERKKPELNPWPEQRYIDNARTARATIEVLRDNLYEIVIKLDSVLTSNFTYNDDATVEQKLNEAGARWEIVRAFTRENSDVLAATGFAEYLRSCTMKQADVNRGRVRKLQQAGFDKGNHIADLAACTSWTHSEVEIAIDKLEKQASEAAASTSQ